MSPFSSSNKMRKIKKTIFRLLEQILTNAMTIQNQMETLSHMWADCLLDNVNKNQCTQYFP